MKNENLKQLNYFKGILFRISTEGWKL